MPVWPLNVICRCVEAACCYCINLMRSLSIPASKTVVVRDIHVFLCFLCQTDSLEKGGKRQVWCFLLLTSRRREEQMTGNGFKACNTLTMLSQELFPSDLSMGELSDTSSAVLTRRYRSLIEVGLSLPSSPMILFSMGQWEVGGGGGEPPLEDTALVGLLFASCCSTERMLRLKLFYAWLHSLFYSSASYLRPFSRSPSISQFRLFLKPLMQQEGRKASVTVCDCSEYCGGPVVE